MLLVNVPGPTSFQHLKIVNGVTHETFRSACQALNFLDNERHWDLCMNEACNTSHPNQLRALFAIILTACAPSSTTALWEKYNSHMSEDISRLLKLILAAIRSHNEIALALASSGIAATLLPGGRTAHSALKLPLKMQFTETPT
jgi:hypothetical protein